VTAADQSSVALEAELSETIDSFDRAFSEGRLDEFSAGFADDAQLLIHQQETITGKEAISASFGQVFDDTSAYQPRYEIIDVRGNRAYVLVSFDEVLRPRDGQPGIRVRGRAVHFWRRENGAWRIVMLLTGRSAPDEVER
jgi:ketosteroid isomerase-like protein